MNRTIRVQPGPTVERIVADALAGDAALVACAAYLVAAQDETGLLTYDHVAKAFGVSGWTVHRWLERLAEKKAITIQTPSPGLAVVQVLEKAPKTVQDAPESAKLLGSTPLPMENPGAVLTFSEAVERHGGNVATAFPPMSMPEAINTVPRQQERLRRAWETFLVSELAQRQDDLEAAKELLQAAARNPLFDRLDLPKEILQADAWLSAHPKKGYRDMVRFLGQWLRRSAGALKQPLRNVNAAPTAGKYARQEEGARGR